MARARRSRRPCRWYRRQEPFDLVIDQHHGIPWYAPWWSGTNCVAYIHEVLGPIWKAFYRWPLNTIGQWQERWTHWLYRAVPFWTPSESTKIVLHRHGVREVKVFPNGTDATPLAELEGKPLRRATAVGRGLTPGTQQARRSCASSHKNSASERSRSAFDDRGHRRGGSPTEADGQSAGAGTNVSRLPANSPKRKRTPSFAARIC